MVMQVKTTKVVLEPSETISINRQYAVRRTFEPGIERVVVKLRAAVTAAEVTYSEIVRHSSVELIWDGPLRISRSA